MMKKLVCAVTALFLLAGCSYKPGPVSTAMDQGAQGTQWFYSNDAYDFQAYGADKQLIVEGDFVLPPNHNGGAVILSHGSGGQKPFHKDWAKVLQDAGYATFRLNHFTPREVINTLHSQVRVTEQQMAFDVINAFDLLSTHPGIDKNRIYHLGWSKGAIAGLLASFDKVQNLVDIKERTSRIAGFVEFYPWCGFRASMKSSSPILILHGTADDYTPLGMCESLIPDLQAAGTDVHLERFEGAYHGFDNWTAETKKIDSVTVRKTTPDCTLSIDPDTLQVRTLDDQFRIDTYDNRKAFLIHCAEKGVMYGGSAQYRDKTEQQVLDFLKK